MIEKKVHNRESPALLWRLNYVGLGFRKRTGTETIILNNFNKHQF